MVDRLGLHGRRVRAQIRRGQSRVSRARDVKNDLTFFRSKLRDARLLAAELGREIIALQQLRSRLDCPAYFGGLGKCGGIRARRREK
jgi:hypothetical protein